MASKWPPVKNSAFTFRCVLFAQSDNQIKSNPTLAAGDWKCSTDGAAFANLATLPDVDPDSTAQVLVSLSAGEMNGDEIVVTAIDASGAEWHSAAWVIHTVGQTLDAMDTILDDVPTTSEFEARTIAAANYATASALDAVDNFVDTEVAAVLAAVDTEVAAIKAKTDNLPAQPAAVGSAMTLASGAVTAAAIAADAGAEIAAAVWDRVLTGATHNIATSAGKRLRDLGASSIADGTAQGGGDNTITLAAGASATDDIYDGNLIVIIAGTGIGQTRHIVEYSGSTKVATVARDWEVNPDATSEYQIIGAQIPESLAHGQAQGGAAGSITLNGNTVGADDFYNGSVVVITSGTGEHQSRLITDYTGATKVATVSPDWVTAPDNTSVYMVLPSARSIVDRLGTQAQAEVNTQADTALTDYDAATAADLAGLSTFDASTDAVIVGTIQADAITASAIAAAAAQEIADAVLSRGVSNVEATADAHSLTAIVLGALESAIVGTSWNIYRTDGTTPFVVKTVTVDAAADPITAVE